jgi:hypothetical protein
VSLPLRQAKRVSDGISFVRMVKEVMKLDRRLFDRDVAHEGRKSICRKVNNLSDRRIL